MSFRDNLIHLRATHNMTQEQLAMLIGVSRQAVTKWEAEKSYPEMDKLIKMCQIFNCTLDELVQGDLTERETPAVTIVESSCPPADVFDYDGTMRRFAWKIALGIAAMIMGVALALPFFDANASGMNTVFYLVENVAAALGLLMIFLGIVIGLALIIPAGLTHSHFVREHPYLEDFYTKEEKARARTSFTYQLIGGIACIFLGLSAAMLFSDDRGGSFAITALLVFAAFGVFLIVHGGMTLGRVDIAQYNMKAAEVLSETEIDSAQMPESYKHELIQTKKTDKRIGAICGTIMIIATIAGLIMLFVPGYQTHLFWLAWPIGGLLCGIAAMLINGFSKED